MLKRTKLIIVKGTKLIIILSVLALPSYAAGSEVQYQTDSLRPMNMPPIFDHGYLAVYERGAVGIYRGSGALQYRIPSDAPEVVSSVAVMADGRAATCVGLANGKGAIGLWDSAGSKLRTIETGDFLPSFVAFGPDGSIWTTGMQRGPGGAAVEDYLILRHFSPQGELLGAFVRRSSFHGDRDPAEPVHALPALRIANDRIGMYFHGSDRKHNVWVEADLNGKELGRWPLPFDGYPAAFTESGAVYARGVDGVYVLDRAAGKWILDPMGSPGDLVGAAGESLVFADRSRALVYCVLDSTDAPVEVPQRCLTFDPVLAYAVERFPYAHVNTVSGWAP
jgi:hypothetical protein